MTFSAPAGNPASAKHSHQASVVIEVSEAGLMIAALPTASAGPIFSAPRNNGKFQGAIPATTPYGW